MKKLSWLLIFTIIFISCEKDDDTQLENLTVLVNNSGTLTVKVMENTQTPYGDALVYVYSDLSEGGVIFQDTTSSDGILNVGKLLEGSYYCRVYAEKDNKDYSDAMLFQIIAGDTKTVEINPFLNVGTISVKIVNNDSIIPYVNVVLIPHNNYSNEDYEFDDLIEEAYFNGTTNSEGWVSFEGVPVGSPYGYEYSIMAYISYENYSYPYQGNSLHAYKNDEQKYTVEVDL